MKTQLNFLVHNVGMLLFGDANDVELWEILTSALNVNLRDHRPIIF